MTAKQYLSQVERLNKMISNKLSEIYQLKSMASNISVLNDGFKIQSSGEKDRIGDMVSQIVDLERDTQKYVDIYMEILQKVIMQIDSMPKETHYKVLFAKYIENKTFDIIAEEMGYSWRQVMRIHGAALSEFEMMYGEDFVSLNVIYER